MHSVGGEKITSLENKVSHIEFGTFYHYVTFFLIEDSSF